MTTLLEKLEQEAESNCIHSIKYPGYRLAYLAGARSQFARIEMLVKILDEIDEISFNNGYHSVSKLSREALDQLQKILEQSK